MVINSSADSFELFGMYPTSIQYNDSSTYLYDKRCFHALPEVALREVLLLLTPVSKTKSQLHTQAHKTEQQCDDKPSLFSGIATSACDALFSGGTSACDTVRCACRCWCIRWMVVIYAGNPWFVNILGDKIIPSVQHKWSAPSFLLWCLPGGYRKQSTICGSVSKTSPSLPRSRCRSTLCCPQTRRG